MDRWSDDFDDDEYPDSEETGLSILESDYTPFDVESPLAHYEGYKHAVSLTVPKSQRQWGRANLNMGQRYLASFGSRYHDEYQKRDFDKVFKKDLREAAVEEIENKIVIRPGIRRSKKVPDAKLIANGTEIYSNEFTRQKDSWAARVYRDDFYTDIVHPFVKNKNSTSIFEWAYDRVQVANGMSFAMGLSRDFPPMASEYPYKKVAPLMFNTSPEILDADREIEMDEDKRILHEQLKKSLREKLCPETIWLVLGNSDIFSMEVLGSSDINEALALVPHWLENGLIIDRVSDLIKLNHARGMNNPKASVEAALKLVKNIYSRRKKPWWFKEDIDFTKTVDWESEADIAPLLARCSGYAFEHSLELYRAGGKAICEVEGVKKQQAFYFLSKVAEDFGIGNTPRATNVVKFAIDLLNNTKVEKRAETLKKFQKYLHKKRPLSEIIGRLEGEDAGIYMPGVFSLVSGQLGEERAKADKLDDVTISVAHLLDLMGPLSRPLKERAKTKPQTRVEYDRQNLLASSADPQLLIEKSDGESSGQEVSPLLGIFEFYEQVEAECGRIDDDLVEAYFAFYAAKMPNPFSPPKNFLSFLNKYRHLRHPDSKFTEMEAPGIAREHARERNAGLLVERHLVVFNLLDAWIAGILSEAQLYKILDSLVTAKTNTGVKEENDEEEDFDYERDRKFLNNRYFVVKRISEMLTANAQFLRMGILTQDEIKDLADDPDVQTMDTASEERSFDELLQAIRVMLSNEILTVKDIRYVFENGNILERGHGMDQSVTARVRALWETADAFYKCHERATEIERELRKELREAIKYDPGDSRAELGEVISRCVDEYYAKFCYECEQIFAGSKYRFRPQIEKLASYLLPLKPFTDILVNFYWKVAYSVSKSNRTLGDLLENAPGAPSLDGSKPVRTSLAMREAQFANSLSIGFYLRPIEEQIGIGRAADKQAGKTGMAKEVSNITNAISAMVAFVMALDESGLESTRLISDKTENIDTSNDADLERNIKAFKERVESIRDKVRENTAKVREAIIEKRKDGIGLVPVGGKIHVLHPIDPSRFKMFKDATGFTSTQFALIHANTSMLLPPTPTAEEQTALISALIKVGIIDSEFPELQVTLPGRLPPEDVAVLGSFILLATETGTEFPEKAFSTNQDYATGARIMAYDAGNTPIGLPFMTALPGRTDMLCRRHAGDINLMQKVGSVLLQAHAKKGPFSKLASKFKENYKAILKKHGIEEVLKGKWIFTPEDSHTDNKANHEHYLLVKKCTDAYFASAESGEGIIFEVRELFDELEAEIRVEQAKLIESGEACEEINLLVG